MPERFFVCFPCRYMITQIQSLHDETIPICEGCGKETRRSYSMESTGGRPTKIFHTPIEMFSVGMKMDEVPAFRRANPGIEVREGIPIARTRQEKKRVLKYFNFEEVT